MDGGKQNPENQSSDQQTNSWNRFSPGPLLDQQAGQAGSMNCDWNHGDGQTHKIRGLIGKWDWYSPCLLDGVWDVRLPWRARQHCLQLYDRARITCHESCFNLEIWVGASTCPSTVRVVQAGQAWVHSVDLTGKIVCLHRWGFEHTEKFSWSVFHDASIK